ncbi:hypothetical protein [Shewanella xiamenensis]|uniref:hypothetical protein n=1 Tax=Shewanella xiamenensis TaxID=332186 RepID=UPI00313C65EE
MENSEIIDLACEVFSKITGDLNDGIYKDLNGNLSVKWSTNRSFYACASVCSSVEEPPLHNIELTYDTATLLYRDIEDYYEYIEFGADNDKFDFWFEGFDYPKSLSSESQKEHCCKNMFISGITWILFHELGHLLQEHGHIRSLYDCNNGSKIVDCAANDSETNTKLSGKASAVSHVTEMAADFYAMVSCLRALLQHFEGDELKSELRGFSSVLALLLYRFHGVNSYIPTEVPEGSHPPPLIRLEQTTPLIFELYSKLTSIKRFELINITSWSSCTVGLFWLRKNNQMNPELPDDFFLAGSLQRPGMARYHKIMIDTWDEIKPIIDSVKRIDDHFSELQFSDEYREKLTSLKTT